MKFKYIKECFTLFVHSIRVGWELICSFMKLSKLSMPVISIFGGSMAEKDGVYSKKAYILAKKFAEHDVSVLTGGGPGIMEAANCGASSIYNGDEDKRKKTIGIAVTGIDTWFVSSCFYHTIRVGYFFMRKWLLIRYSVGFVVFPGGVGTVDELFDLLNLMKHHKIPQFPVVLIGRDYWKPIIDWFQDSALKNKLIDEKLTKMFVVTDNTDEAFEVVYDFCKRFKST